jgi:hypothetical protein
MAARDSGQALHVRRSELARLAAGVEPTRVSPIQRSRSRVALAFTTPKPVRAFHSRSIGTGGRCDRGDDSGPDDRGIVGITGSRKQVSADRASSPAGIRP